MASSFYYGTTRPRGTRCRCRDFKPLDPAAVDNETLARDGGAVIGSKKKDKASTLVRPNDPLQCLSGKDLGFVSFCEPEPFLPLRLNGARHDAIDSDIVN